MPQKRVLILSIRNDLHADRIQELLSESAEVVRVNVDSSNSWRLEYCSGDVTVIANEMTYKASEFSAAYIRQMPSFEYFLRSVPEPLSEFREYIAHQKQAIFLDCLSIMSRVTFLVNPLASSNYMNKGIQNFVAKKVGLNVPATYIGSTPIVAKEFANHLLNSGNKICSKPVVNSKLTINGMVATRFTEIMEPESIDEIDSLIECPLIFQSYTEKKFEVRGAIVGEEIFAASIHSQNAPGKTKIDWRRYNIPQTPHYKLEIPGDVRKKLVDLHKALSMHISQFDLIVDHENEYVFLETNPFGQWLWIEDLTSLPISKAISDFILHA